MIHDHASLPDAHDLQDGLIDTKFWIWVRFGVGSERNIFLDREAAVSIEHYVETKILIRKFSKVTIEIESIKNRAHKKETTQGAKMELA